MARNKPTAKSQGLTRLDEIVGYVKCIAEDRRDYWAMQSLLGGFEKAFCAELAYCLNQNRIKGVSNCTQLWRLEYKIDESPRMDIAQIKSIGPEASSSIRIADIIEMKVAHYAYMSGEAKGTYERNVAKHLVDSMAADFNKYTPVIPNCKNSTHLFRIGVLLETRPTKDYVPAVLLNGGVKYGFLSPKTNGVRTTIRGLDNDHEQALMNSPIWSKNIPKNDPVAWHLYDPFVLGTAFGWRVRWHIIGVHNKVYLKIKET